MSNLSNSMGEGGGGGRHPGGFTDTGYGTHDGQGNVPTGAQFEKGTGYDEKGQVATSFGKWPVAYDPVTGMAVEHVTSGYDMGGADVGGGSGLVDVSAAAPGHSAVATPAVQRAVQQFFENRRQAAPARQQQPSAGQEAGAGQEPQADEGTGQGVAERLDAGAYLPDQPEWTGQEAEAWRDRHS